jgi:hypothetical protein
MFSSLSAALGTPGAVSISAIAAATVLGGLAVVFIAGVSDAKAKPVTEVAVQTLAKGDRLPVLQKGAACSTRAWPNYEPICQFDVRRPFGEMPIVRIIALR